MSKSTLGLNYVKVKLHVHVMNFLSPYSKHVLTVCMSFWKEQRTNLEEDFLCVLRDLPNSRIAQFSRHAHPGVNSCHGDAQLLHGYNDNAVRKTWERRGHQRRLGTGEERNEDELPSQSKCKMAVNPSSFVLLVKLTELTDGGEGVGKTEVVHSVEGQQVEQKLFPFLLTEQERVRFIQLPVGGNKESIRKVAKYQVK